MASELELALFEEEFTAVQSLPEATRWQLERDNSVPLGLFAVMHPISSPTELYKARIRWNTSYFAPFSLKYVDMNTGAENNPTAWPLCPGFRPASFDTCITITSEGHALHPEWAGQFPKVALPMQHALLHLQLLLDNSYMGRARR